MKSETKFTKILITVISVYFIAGPASARISFLPAAQDTGGFRENIYDPCSDYELPEPPCKGKPCEIGWICESCTDKSGTYHRCEPKETPLGYTAGLTSCEPCHTYSHLGFSGSKINGKCTPIENCSDKAETPEQPTFKYISGIKIEENTLVNTESIGYKK